MKKKILIALIVGLVAYYAYYTFMKPCKCNCANGGECKCKKNPLLKAFDSLNTTVGLKRSGCKKSTTTNVIAKDNTDSISVTEDPTACNETLKNSDVAVADNVMGEAQSKTNEELIFAEQHNNIAKGDKERLLASRKVDSLIMATEKKLDEQMCLKKNLADDPRLTATDVSKIDANCESEINKLKQQIKLLRHMKAEILDNNGYENVGYGIYVLKGVMHPESVHKVYNHLLDRTNNKKDWTILCKKDDITNIGMVVPCENIIDLYWNEFLPIKK